MTVFLSILLFFFILAIIIVLIVLRWIPPIVIGENEVGIVIKASRLPFQKSLPSHQRIALGGEAGIQADTLPPGQHWGYPSWMYTIRRVARINIPPDEIGLVSARDGNPISAERQLGRLVACKDFQDARAFLKNGQKGQQLGILTPGEYGINTELFDVTTSSNLNEYSVELRPEDLRVYKVDSDQIGIVTTYDGGSLPAGEMAAPSIAGHNSFQDGQTFIDEGGYKGLQEEVLSAGAYNLNPWFVKVKLVKLTHIPAGTVGVVISHVGKTPIYRVIAVLLKWR